VDKRFVCKLLLFRAGQCQTSLPASFSHCFVKFREGGKAALSESFDVEGNGQLLEGYFCAEGWRCFFGRFCAVERTS
jgi:hypothetical protein